jgi:hypothetical protein
MAKQTINVGSTANDGTGDKLRDAFVKVNANFTELYSDDVGDVDSVNAGTGISVNQTTGAVTVTNIGTLDNATDNGATTTNSITVGGLHVNSTGAVEMPTGTDGERPSPTAGMFRFNTTSNEFEGYDGTEWGSIGGAGSSLVQDNFTGNGSTVDFTLSVSVLSDLYTNVYIGGVYQEKGTYSVAGSTLTFSTAPPNGISIEVITIDNITIITAELANYSTEVISSNANAVKNTLYVLTANLTLTLPSSPLSGDSIKISNLSGVATCVLARNGSLIMGVASDLTLDTPSASFELIYSGATKGWVIVGL